MEVWVAIVLYYRHSDILCESVVSKMSQQLLIVTNDVQQCGVFNFVEEIVIIVIQSISIAC